jgi:hypothetical protein
MTSDRVTAKYPKVSRSVSKSVSRSVASVSRWITFCLGQDSMQRSIRGRVLLFPLEPVKPGINETPEETPSHP